MTIQIIYTKETGQDLANFTITKEIIKTKKRLIQFATDAFIGKYSFANERWQEISYQTATISGKVNIPEEINHIPILYKLSLMVNTNGEKIRIPKWYKECEGKIWWEDLHPHVKNPIS